MSHRSYPETVARHAFTLVELLVVVAIVSLLISLVLPTVGQSLERGRSAACQQNLRQVMTGLYSAIMDHDGLLYLHSNADDENMSWAGKVYETHFGGATSVFLCPGYAPGQFHPQLKWMSTYGVREDPPDEYVYRPDFDTAYLITDGVEKPGDFLLLTDTTSNGRGGIRARQYRTFNVSMSYEVHARHVGLANGAFLDGHVEAMDRDRLERLGIDALYARDEAPGYF